MACLLLLLSFPSTARFLVFLHALHLDAQKRSEDNLSSVDQNVSHIAPQISALPMLPPHLKSLFHRIRFVVGEIQAAAKHNRQGCRRGFGFRAGRVSGHPDMKFPWF